MKHAVLSDKAPAPIGPYSQAVRVGDWLFLSGSLGIDPGNGEFVPGDAAAQARKALENMREVLAAAGATFDHVVKTTVFLADMDDFVSVNAVYGEFFTGTPPARSAVQAARLPKDAFVEIEAIAFLG
ncbi:MAG: deaminase [Thermoplasmata archaeon]|nr:RidA family protein [Thermoplasmata archaeon]NIS11320.1 RidA family protein [Thermoplasmata archaeon]NIS19258.1 RidA family protein [Thermoplasmata archaeon]NIT76333.1 RidA family protein [Thermoplasmata archaeon]NIU48393.1 RidA family protein [Thermoplasmata archaeon]